MEIRRNRHRLPGAEPLLKDIAALERLCFTDPWSERMIRETLEADRVFLFTLGEEPVGYLMLLLLPPEAEILNLAVHPAFRRRRYAAALLFEAEAFCRKCKVERVYLEVRASNSSALALYKGNGFETVGRRRNYYRNPKEDALLMAKSLGCACAEEKD